jgi:hypothetical protein
VMNLFQAIQFQKAVDRFLVSAGHTAVLS